jgi:pimeloyl-ACP methyl ester carboxylesterase
LCDSAPCIFNCAAGHLSQDVLEFGEDLLDRIEIGAVGRQKQQPGASLANGLFSLADQARLVEAALPAGADQICLVGHSFGGAVAMKVAARLSGRVVKLVLLEPIPFQLLAQAGYKDAFAEAVNLCNIVRKYGAVGEWSTAAEKFADYWTGSGTWGAMSPDRRLAFSEALKPNLFEWDAVMDDTTPVEEWAARHCHAN